VNRAGFPIAYLYFKHNMQENEDSLSSGCKIPALTAMFRSMHERGFSPLFMFCDKDIVVVVRESTESNVRFYSIRSREGKHLGDGKNPFSNRYNGV
jgi:hypothetical protein